MVTVVTPVYCSRARKFLPDLGANYPYQKPGGVLADALKADGSPNLLKDPGAFAVYPVPLDRTDDTWVSEGRSPLRLEITLSAPLEEQETWFLVCVFEHAGKALFERGKYASEFSLFPWQ